MPIKVKFLAKFSGADPTEGCRRFLPDGKTLVNGVEFVFRPDCREYDWLVVYDDMPSSKGERFPRRIEQLACPRENTLFLTGEPSSIKVYGKRFLAQFGHVLTSQEAWALPHPRATRAQCGLIWFYGKTFTEAAAHFPKEKEKLFSTVCSSKQQTHTLHSLRYDFTQQLKKAVPELEVFGHGHRYIESKVEALDPFKYHLAVENHCAPHHWTEKLADTFLGGCLPFYHGCPNVYDYFPEESLVRIDIRDAERSFATIKESMRNNEYEKRLPAIREARRLILEKYSTFPMLARLITDLPQSQREPTGEERILSRHAWRREFPLAAVAYGFERFITHRKAASERKKYLHKESHAQNHPKKQGVVDRSYHGNPTSEP